MTFQITYSGDPTWIRHAKDLNRARAIIRKACGGYAEGCGTYAIEAQSTV